MNDLWETLRRQDSPILLYGMGNGADKILGVCEKKGIPIAGVFASDGFARGNLFHGMRVTTYAQACETYGDFRVLVSFATSRDEVLENVCRIASERETYIPDIPVAGDRLFDGEFYENNRQALETARELFADDLSKKVYDLVVESKLTGRLSPLLEGCTTQDDDFRTLLHPEGYRVCGDFGAYTGDTAADLAARCPRLTTVLAVEPDPKTFLRLQKNVGGLPVTAVNAAAWDKNEVLSFTVGGNRGSGVGAAGKKQVSVRGIPGDGLFENLHADYLKFDVEGAEAKALSGLHATISRDKPEMLVSLYHRPEDLFEIPLYLHDRYPFYRFYLRRHKGIPAWDINLYALPVIESVF